MAGNTGAASWTSPCHAIVARFRAEHGDATFGSGSTPSCGRQGQRLSTISASGSAKRESGDESARAKSRDVRSILSSLGKPGKTQECVAGAAGIEPRYGDFESGCSCLPERICRTPFIRIHKPLETLEFREPYRIRGVQSSGEN